MCVTSTAAQFWTGDGLAEHWGAAQDCAKEGMVTDCTCQPGGAGGTVRVHLSWVRLLHCVPAGASISVPETSQASICCTPGRQVVPAGLSMIMMPTASSRARTASASSKSLACGNGRCGSEMQSAMEVFICTLLLRRARSSLGDNHGGSTCHCFSSRCMSCLFAPSWLQGRRHAHSCMKAEPQRLGARLSCQAQTTRLQV